VRARCRAWEDGALLKELPGAVKGSMLPVKSAQGAGWPSAQKLKEQRPGATWDEVISRQTKAVNFH
jgi:hypothetical protein